MAVSFPIPRIASVCSDGELIQRTGEGDRAAFDKLYRRYARPVFGLALRRLGDRGRAEDAVQETFVSIWRSASTYKPEREREVIALAYWSDLSQSEVAVQLGIPLGTVKTRTRSALMHLAEILEGELE